MSPQAGFILLNEIVPRLKSAIPNAVCFVGCEDVEELVQDATAIAAKLLHSVEARGKAVTPGNIAYYATKLTRQGRRSTGQRKNDPLDPMAQLSGNCALVSLDAPLTNETDGEPLILGEVLASEAEDPSSTGARNLDWQAFVKTLDELALGILEYLAEGRPLRELAQAVGMSRSGIQLHKERLSAAVQAFMGAELMQQLQHRPQWRIDVTAVRERIACRHERLSA